ncbi:MAG TPA: histidine--tRNA ligase [Candidatus Acidoferrales bacterium]|nr:histidine--tRNA ligase [Candidatus Acidoferrales bacterium]
MEKIEPQNVKGFRDLMPRYARKKNEIISIIKMVYESFGFLPLETPGLEYLEILLGEYGEENTKQIFRLKSPEEQEAALRFDLTVPLARIVAQYNDLPKPFKRYQVGSVWRADKPDPGRFREFTQFDIDVVGTSSQLAEAEVISAVVMALREIGVGGFIVGVNSRKVLNAVIAYSGISSVGDPAGGKKAKDIFRVLDKLNKIGMQNVELELTKGRYDSSGDFIPGLGLTNLNVKKIENYLALPKGNRKEVLAKISELLGKESCEDLQSLDDFLNVLGIGSEVVMLDPTIARGLDYYTGPVFEVNLKNKPQFGSIAGGGRYDNLVKRFTNVDLPAVGFSIGIDRLLTAIDDKSDNNFVDVVITIMEQDRFTDYLRIANELREAGIKTDLYLGTEKGLRKQLQYADKVGAGFAIIIGSNEFEKGTVTIKDLTAGAEASKDAAKREEWLKKSREVQREIPRNDLVQEIKKLLASE